MREAVLASDYLKENSKDKSNRKNQANRWKYILVISIAIASLFLGAGLIISGLAYIGLVEHSKVLSRIGTIMIVVSAPLFVLSAHCLDEMRFEDKRTKRVLYQENVKNKGIE